MGIKFSDNALTLLASSILSTDTTLAVTPGTGDRFPVLNPYSASDYFVITMEDSSGNREFIRCNYRASGSDTLGSVTYPLQRAYWSSTARAWTTGDSVDLRPSANLLSLFMIGSNNLSELSSAAAALANLGLTATAAELNIMDGVTATAAELNILDGVTATAAELNILDGVTATAAELNILDGVTATAAELNILDGVTASTAELNILDGVTASTAELNFVDGVTSAIQAQLDAKAPLASPALTGVPTAPTASAGTNTTQIATTAFVLANAAGACVNGETTYNTNTTLSISTDNGYLIRCTVASVVYTFPAATGNEGKYWWITNQTSNDTGVRLVCNGAESIGGATGATIYIPAYTTIGFVSDNSNWLVFSRTPMFWEFNANGTWYCPPGIYEIEVDGSGGGGGGGGTSSGTSRGAGGGGSGARCTGKKITVVPGTQYSITIGAGGSGGAVGDNDGSSGSSTSLGALLTLAGGGGGLSPATYGRGGDAGDKGMSGTPGITTVGGTGGFGPAGLYDAKGVDADANSGGGGSGAFGVSGVVAGGNGGSGYLRIKA